MNENMRKWIDALRSGEYEQANGTLRRLGDVGEVVGYCCLGVACEISGLGHWENESYLVDGGASSGVLSSKMKSWLGLSYTEEGHGNVVVDLEGRDEYSLKPLREDVTVLNDIQNKNFNEIADALERTYGDG